MANDNEGEMDIECASDPSDVTLLAYLSNVTQPADSSDITQLPDHTVEDTSFTEIQQAGTQNTGSKLKCQSPSEKDVTQPADSSDIKQLPDHTVEDTSFTETQQAATQNTDSELKCQSPSENDLNTYTPRYEPVSDNHTDKNENLKHVCDYCNAQYINEDSLNQHRRKHIINDIFRKKKWCLDDVFKCEYCDVPYSSQAALNKHRKTHHKTKKFKLDQSSDHTDKSKDNAIQICEFCDARYSNSISLQQHKRTHGGDRPYVCRLCNGTFSELSSFMSHKLTRTSDTGLKCQLCSLRFCDVQMLSEHVRIKHECMVTCDHCDRQFMNRTELSIHQHEHNTQTDTILTRCSVCGKQCFGEQHLIQHLKTHRKIFTCRYCNETIADIEQFLAHIRHHKEPGTDQVENEPVFICKYCDKKFKEFKEFGKHVMIHTQNSRVKPKCQLCNKTFACLDKLKSHEATHKLYRCCLCENVFLDLSLFRTHVLSCDAETHITKKGRPQIHTPRIHTLIHGHPEKFQCLLCNKIFISLDKLKSHQATHKLYRCCLCEKEFPELALFRTHVLSCGDETDRSKKKRPLICSVCERVFHNFHVFLLHSIKHKEDVTSATCQECKAEFAYMKGRIMSKHKREISESSEILMKYLPDGRIQYMFMPSVDKFVEIDKVIHAESKGGHQLIFTTKMDEQNNGDKIKENCLTNDKETDKQSFPVGAVVYVNDRHLLTVEDAETALQHNDDYKVDGKNVDSDVNHMFKTHEKESEHYQVSYNENLFSQNKLDDIIVKQEICELNKNVSESLTSINHESVKEPQINNDISKGMIYQTSSCTNEQPAYIMQDGVLIKQEICDYSECPNETGKKCSTETFNKDTSRTESSYENDPSCSGISYIDIQTSKTIDSIVIKQEPYDFNEDQNNLAVESPGYKPMDEHWLNPVINNENGNENLTIPGINDQTAYIIDGITIKQEPDDYYKDPNKLIEPLVTEPVTERWFSPAKTYENDVGSQGILQLSIQAENNKASDMFNLQETTCYHEDRTHVMQFYDKSTEPWSSSGNNYESDAGTHGITPLNKQDESKIEGLSIKQEPTVYSKDRSQFTEPDKEPVFICKYCDKKFAKFNEFTKHILIHTPEVRYECQQCGKAFADVSNLKRHKATHMPFRCDLCKKRFPVISLFRKHRFSCTAEPQESEKNRPLICSLCGQTFHNLDVFLQHAVQHKGEVKSATCEECKAEFAYMKGRGTSKYKGQTHQPSEVLLKFLPDGRVQHMFIPRVMPNVDKLEEIDHVIHKESKGGHQLIFTKNVEEQNDSDKINENQIANDKTPDNQLIFPS